MSTQNYDFLSAQRWLLEHSEVMESWLDDQLHKGIIDLEDYDDKKQIFFQQPIDAVTVMEDFLLDNRKKIEQILRAFLDSEYVLSVVYGDPGSGKTSFNYQILSFLHELAPEVPIYALGTWKKPFFIKDVLFDLNDIPPNSFVYLAELSKFFPSRDSSSIDNKKLSSQLAELRHFNIKVFGEVQKAALCDINIVRFANFIHFKYMSPYNISFEREFTINPLIELLMPKDIFDKSQTLSICQGRFFTYNIPSPDFFTEDLSKNLASITEAQKLNYAKDLFKRGYSVAEVRSRLSTHFRYSKDIDFWKNLQLGIL